jgi:hypothetical protein
MTIHSISLSNSLDGIVGMLSEQSGKINACVLFSGFTLRTNEPNTCTSKNIHIQFSAFERHEEQK